MTILSLSSYLILRLYNTGGEHKHTPHGQSIHKVSCIVGNWAHWLTIGNWVVFFQFLPFLPPSWLPGNNYILCNTVTQTTRITNVIPASLLNILPFCTSYGWWKMPFTWTGTAKVTRKLHTVSNLMQTEVPNSQTLGSKNQSFLWVWQASLPDLKCCMTDTLWRLLSMKWWVMAWPSVKNGW